MGVPPQGGGAYDAVNHAFDVEEYDSVASADTVEKAVSDVASGVEGDFLTEHVFQRVVLDDVLYLGATKVPQNAAMVIDPNNGNMFAAWQAGAGSTPSGIVGAWSTDGGFTWTAPVQLTGLDEPFVPSLVINPVDGDIHMCVAKRGMPVLDGTWDIWYKVLPWDGAAWDLTLVTSIVADGSTGVGYSNASLAVDDSGYLTVAFMERETDNDVFIDTLVSNAPWDLNNYKFVSEFQISGNLEARPKLLWGDDDDGGDTWMMVVEQLGTYRLYRSPTDLSVSNDLVWTQTNTYYEPSTDEFDAVHLSLSPSGGVGIVQKNGDKVEFRTWSPYGGTLSSPTIVEGDASNPCRYPAVMVDGSEFIVAYARELDTDDHQIVFQRSQNNGATWNVDKVTLDQDDVGNHWGWIKLPPTTARWDRFAMIWCDNALSPYDVHFGQAAISVIRSAGDSSVGTDTIAGLENVVTETPEAVEELVAGEAVGPVLETASAVEDLSQERPVAETGTAVDTYVIDPLIEEAVEGVETFPGGADIAFDEAGSAAEDLVSSEEKVATDIGTATEELGGINPDTVQDAGTAVESFPAMDRSVIERVNALESFIEAEPNIIASIYDIVAGHTSTLLRLDTGEWTERSEQLGVGYPYQGMYFFEHASGMDQVLFRRSVASTSPISGWREFSNLERSADLGATWTSVLPACAGVDFGPNGTGFAIAAGGDTRVHRVYKSTDKGATWTEVWEDPNVVNTFYSSYQKISVDPYNDDHVALVGHAEGDSTAALVFSVTLDGFTTAPDRKLDPVPGIWSWRPIQLACGLGGRWVLMVTPSFMTDIRNKIYTSDDDGDIWTVRLDERRFGNNAEFEDLLYNKATNVWYAVKRSESSVLWRGSNNGESWLPIDIDFIVDPDDPSSVLNVMNTTIEAVALAYDKATGTVYVGTQDSRFPVIAALNPQPAITWSNLRSNMVNVTGPESTPAASVRCSAEGLVSVAPVGAVQTAFGDVASAVEALETLYSVAETAVGFDEIVERVVGVVEEAVGDDTLIVSLFTVESSSGAETLTVLLEITDAVAAAEVLATVSEVWLAVRLLLHEGIARLRVEGPGG